MCIFFFFFSHTHTHTHTHTQVDAPARPRAFQIARVVDPMPRVSASGKNSGERRKGKSLLDTFLSSNETRNWVERRADDIKRANAKGGREDYAKRVAKAFPGGKKMKRNKKQR
eukprot:GHVR01180400.1.p1 GENE.GHVR01180400.1~~GHVR01180400.1.p1  ORF type:complete len:113 (-),score=40.79 GHVR01180400.1:203-541(-)